jgi:hypothetical protein
MRATCEPQGWAPGGRPDAQGDVGHSKITNGVAGALAKSASLGSSTRPEVCRD